MIYYVHTFDLLSKIDSVIGNNHNKKPNPNSGQLTDSIKALLSSSTNISNRAVRKNSYRNQVSVDTKVLSPTKKPSLHEKVSDNRIIKDEEEREWNYDQNSNEFIVPDESNILLTFSRG